MLDPSLCNGSGIFVICNINVRIIPRSKVILENQVTASMIKQLPIIHKTKIHYSAPLDRHWCLP